MTTAAQHPHLSVVPPMPADPPTPLEGVVVAADKTPATLRSDSAIARAVDHVRHHHGYLPLAGRGYRRLVEGWVAGYHDYHPHLVATAEQALADETDIARQDSLRETIDERRAAYRRHRLIYTTKSGMWGMTAAAATTAGTLSGGLWVTIAAGLGAYLYGIRHGVDAAPKVSATPPAARAHGTSVAVPGPPQAAAAASPAGADSDHAMPADAMPADESALLSALVKADVITAAEQAETRVVGGIRRDGPGWAARIELPEGMPANKATVKIANLAGALRKKASQIEFKPDSSEDAHEGMVTLWVGDHPNPHAGPKVYSELVSAPRWHFWRDGIPLGMDARQARQILRLIWSSILIGGLQDYGKSYLARLIAAAAALDPTVRIIVITGKKGPDWAPLKRIAHRYIAGSDPDTIREIFSTMTTVIDDMQARGDELDRLFEEEPHRVPEGKITPELAADGMGPVLVIVEELQELLGGAALTKMPVPDDDSDKPRLVSAKPLLVDLFARFNRAARFVLGMGVYITQRPDATGVPTELREVCVKRASFRTKSRDSSEMILGDMAVAAGASPHALLESSKGVFVLEEGAEDGYRTLRGDVIDLPDFARICERGRQLRIEAGTLSGDAAERDRRAAAAAAASGVRAEALAALDSRHVDRMRTERLAEALGLTAEELKAQLRAAGVGDPTPLGEMEGLKNPRGYKREALASA
ncbi:hypothetical protein [Streptomyces sp. NPDC012888]|uniref:hypothetical protein n=1 Tax=Streptomyces sp. NPDC012888 TaxID=3364855 RepID=UPI0036842D6C